MRPAMVAMAVGALALASAADAARVPSAVRQQAQRDGQVEVVVLLRPPAGGSGVRRVRPPRARAAAVAAAATTAGAMEIVRDYRTVDGFVARASADALEALAAHPDVMAVDFDVPGHTAATDGIVQVGAHRVHRRGLTGSGATIAVVDGGVQAAHPDIADALIEEACFCRSGRIGPRARGVCCPGGMAERSGPGSARSFETHGPHVAGIALSRGVLAPFGMAPGAALVAVRVLDDHNEGLLSDWVAALDWIAAERPEVRVVNMSLVSYDLFTGDCGHGGAPAVVQLLAQAIERLWQRGTVVFAAAGNDGRGDALTAPACIGRTIAVGAVDGDDTIADFSNGGPGLDLLAPGVDILSDAFNGIAMMSGTSMATPHAAGAAALLVSMRPELSAAAIAHLLAASGTPVLDPRSGRTVPRVDAFAAMRTALRAAERERGGGSGRSDCLLEWAVVPPEIVTRRGWPLARCRDGDPACDADLDPGRCTFLLSPCFNVRDPALPQCATDEPLIGFAVRSPPVNAPRGSLARGNVDQLASALPDFPFAGESVCNGPVPFVVERPAGGIGRGYVRMAVRTATRRDYDQLALECGP